MKKTISILLALTMLFALCVPSFAKVNLKTPDSTHTTIDQTGSTVGEVQTSDAIVHVTGNAAENETYSVTFPADIPLTWGDYTENKLQYTITSNLLSTHKIKVDVTSRSKSKVSNTFMYLETNDSDLTLGADEEKIAYTLGGALTYQTASSLVKDDNHDITVTVDPKEFDGKDINQTYQDKLTFAVTVVNA